ncbi:unnamed protein product [Cunninghamella echinulata]
MLTSILDIFKLQQKNNHQPQRRKSSIQGSLPVSITTSSDVEPLTPLIITSPISVPPSRYDSSKNTYTSSSSMDSLSHTFFECASPLSTSSSLSLSSSTSSTSSSSSSSSYFSDILSPISPTDTIINDELIESLSSKLELATSIEEELIQEENNNNKKNSLLETFRQFQSFLVDTSTNSLTWMTPPEVDDTITLPTTNTNDIYFPPPPYHVRSLRANPDHLRMIVAEVNMMRANKIVSPLRPRAVLLERNDPFLPCQPSPLKYCI